MNWDAYADEDLVRIACTRALERLGYVVRHKSEASRALSWNRTAPIPDNVDFKAEALAKLREQITPEMIRFEVDPGEGTQLAIHRAVLRIL